MINCVRHLQRLNELGIRDAHPICDISKEATIILSLLCNVWRGSPFCFPVVHAVFLKMVIDQLIWSSSCLN